MNGLFIKTCVGESHRHQTQAYKIKKIVLTLEEMALDSWITLKEKVLES